MIANGTVPWVVWVIAIPLAAATSVFVTRTRAAWQGLVAATAVSSAVAGLAVQVWRSGPQRYPVGGWGAPLGIDLHADGLSAGMLLMTAVIGFAVSVYAAGFFTADRRGEREDAGNAGADFWALWLFLWAALNALFLSGDIFNLYVTLELVTLAAVGLVTLARTATAVAAALQYLLAALFGSLLYLLGVALLYSTYGVLDIASLGRVVAPGAETAAAVALMAAGLAVKGAVFPLHFWLPPAHANAPAPVSALLSALVVKASFYLLLRLWYDAFPAAVSTDAAAVLSALGALAIGWGSLQAILAPGLKALVAYSTVAQLGYLFLVFALAPTGERSAAWAGGVLFAISHACAKASMFLAAGSVVRVAGHDRIDGLRGIGTRIPVTFFTIAAAGVTLMGLPPSGAFVAKWMLLDAALERGQTGIALTLLAGGLLAAAYVFRVLSQAFTPTDSARLDVPRTMEGAALALALAGLLLGFVSVPLLDLLHRGADAAARAAAGGS